MNVCDPLYCNYADPNYFGETSKVVETDGFPWLNKRFHRYKPLPRSATAPIKFSFGSLRPQQRETTKSIAKNYEMNRWPHGVAVIINNEKFEGGDKREGTEIDEKNLVQLFLFLGYIVEVHQDCKAKEIQDIMKEVGVRSHSNYDSFVCCIMSHGSDGKINGTDHVPVSLEEITAELKGGTLVDKPKMFFIQACRGTTWGKRIATDDGSHQPEGIACDNIPDESYFFIGYPTPRGHVAFRSFDEGSWFISELCRSFASYAPFTNLNDMMMIASDRVAIEYEYRGAKQAVEFTTKMRKNVFFFL